MAGDDDDDDMLWRSMTKGVQKLDKPNIIAPSLPARRVRIRPHTRRVELPYHDRLSYLSPGISPDIDKSNAEKLKRGQHPIEARLDLHGTRQEDAHQQLQHFIIQSYNEGKRCVLVITGKGLRPDGSKGIIRTNVPVWLNEAVLRPYILAFRYAKVPDGGEGALYVLLKRSRE